jgi:hypothetical protein
MSTPRRPTATARREGEATTRRALVRNTSRPLRFEQIFSTLISAFQRVSTGWPT